MRRKRKQTGRRERAREQSAAEIRKAGAPSSVLLDREGGRELPRRKGRGNTFDFPRVREKGAGKQNESGRKRRAANEKYQKAISKEAPSNFTLREASLGAREPASSAAVARVPREERDATRLSPWKRRSPLLLLLRAVREELVAADLLAIWGKGSRGALSPSAQASRCAQGPFRAAATGPRVDSAPVVPSRTNAAARVEIKAKGSPAENAASSTSLPLAE